MSASSRESSMRWVGKVAVELYEGSPRIAKSVEHEASERHPGHDFLGRSGKRRLQIAVGVRSLVHVTATSSKVGACEAAAALVGASAAFERSIEDGAAREGADRIGSSPAPDFAGRTSRRRAADLGGVVGRPCLALRAKMRAFGWWRWSDRMRSLARRCGPRCGSTRDERTWRPR